MELIRNELNALRLALRTRAQTELEGAIPPPPGRSIAAVIDYSAEARVDACRADAGTVSLEGRLTASLLAQDAGGECFAFTSRSPFTYVLRDGAIENGMLAACAASLAALDVRRAADGRIMLSSVIDLDITVCAAGPTAVLGGVRGVDDLEIKTRSTAYSERTELGRATVSLSDELSSDGAEAVLSHSVMLFVRDTAAEGGSAAVSGVAVINALVKNTDGELSSISRSIPFRESMELSAGADEVYAEARLVSSSARALGTELSLIGVTAEAELRLYGVRRTELTLPLDAFSPTLNFACVRKKTALLSSLGGTSLQHALRENLTVPDGMPDVFSAVRAGSRAIVTELACGNGEVLIEGLLPTSLLYRTENRELRSFTEDVPFSFTVAAPPGTDHAEAEVGCVCSVAGGGSRIVQAAYTLCACVRFFSCTEVPLAVGLAEQNSGGGRAVPEGFSGLVVYAPLDGEGFFDAAKRFRVPSKRVRELNPEASEPLSGRDRLLIVI